MFAYLNQSSFDDDVSAGLVVGESNDSQELRSIFSSSWSQINDLFCARPLESKTFLFPDQQQIAS